MMIDTLAVYFVSRRPDREREKEGKGRLVENNVLCRKSDRLYLTNIDIYNTGIVIRMMILKGREREQERQREGQTISITD